VVPQTLHWPNTTTIHTHGLHIDPSGIVSGFLFPSLPPFFPPSFDEPSGLVMRLGGRLSHFLNPSPSLPHLPPSLPPSLSPSPQADNMFRTLASGETALSEYHIRGDHQSGTFYYHPHYHGSSTIQMAGGMGGELEGGREGGKERRMAFFRPQRIPHFSGSSNF